QVSERSLLLRSEALSPPPFDDFYLTRRANPAIKPPRHGPCRGALLAPFKNAVDIYVWLDPVGFRGNGDLHPFMFLQGQRLSGLEHTVFVDGFDGKRHRRGFLVKRVGIFWPSPSAAETAPAAIRLATRDRGCSSSDESPSPPRQKILPTAA